MLGGSSENMGRGWINGESKYSGSTYRLPVAQPVTGTLFGLVSAFFLTLILSNLTWNFPVFIDVPLSKVVGVQEAWYAMTHYISMSHYDNIFNKIHELPNIYIYEIYLHTLGIFVLSLAPAAGIGWYIGMPRSVIRHISGVKLREGKDAINYANRMIKGEQ